MNYAIIENNIVHNIVVAGEEIANQFGWIPVSENCVIGSTYDGQNFHLPVLQEVDYTEENKQQAQALLISTDWVALSDISNANSNPKLLNVSDFINYRSEIRSILINTPNTAITWPTKPTENWLL